MTSSATAERPAGWSSPLREIELAAQARAKGESLDMSAPDAVARLQAIVTEEVDLWRTEYRRGRRDLDIADPDAAIVRALRNLAGYGPLEPLLADPDVWEIMIWGELPDQFRESPGESGCLLTAHARR